MSPVFTEEEKQFVFLFVPGLYSGYFPGGADAPDRFRRVLGSLFCCYCCCCYCYCCDLFISESE